MTSQFRDEDFQALYAQFSNPIAQFDCGSKCAPYNERGVPFCCDTRHSVPTAYQAEWQYLQENTELWHLWEAGDSKETQRLRDETPDGMILIECQGHLRCQREFRSMTCRGFPFYPYINSKNEFLGLAYYWEYEERCWVINHLDIVTLEYRAEFVQVYDYLFTKEPKERKNFAYHAQVMRTMFTEFKRQIPILHRDENAYLINPVNEQMESVSPENLPKFGPHEVAAMMPFPDEE